MSRDYSIVYKSDFVGRLFLGFFAEIGPTLHYGPNDLSSVRKNAKNFRKFSGN